jgi:hypothetical protein
MQSSQSATQLHTPAKKPHLASPTKGGGFKSVQTTSQEALAVDLARALPVDTSILPRHVIDSLPSESRKLVGNFEGHREGKMDMSKISDSADEYDDRGEGAGMGGLFSSSGLKGSFIPPSSSQGNRPNTSDGTGLRGNR